jgi:heat shock protein HtpX
VTTRFRPDHGLTARMLVTVALLVVVYAVFVVALVVLIRSVVLVVLVAGGVLLAQFWFSVGAGRGPTALPVRGGGVR